MFLQAKFSRQTLFAFLLILSSNNANVLSQSGLIDNVDRRIKRQSLKIDHGVSQGTLKAEQAQKFEAVLKDIASESTTARQQSGGKLSETQIRKDPGAD